MTQTSKPLSPAATAILDQIKIGTVLLMHTSAMQDVTTVSEITEKSIKFTNGKYTNKRSLANFTVIG